MKKVLTYWAGLWLAVLSVCILFPSCGDDDNDDNGSSSDVSVQQLLIGTWEGMDDTDILRYSFRSDGTGYGYEAETNAFGKIDYQETWSFQWYYNPSTKILSMTLNSYDYDPEAFYIINVNSKKLTVYWAEYDHGTWDIDYSEKMVLEKTN